MTRLVASVCAAALLLGSGGPARADDQKEMNELIAKAVKAHGGADNLAKIKALVMKSKGKFYGLGDEGLPFTGIWYIEHPDRIRVEVTSEIMGQAFKFVQASDKGKGWILIGEDLKDLDKEHLDESREEMHANQLGRLVGLDAKDCKLAPVGEVKVNDRPALGVRVECKGYRDVTLFFDKENNQLVKSERRAKDVDAGKEYTAETLYGDYKKLDGVLTAHKVTINRDGKLFVESEVTEFEKKDMLDDKLFKKP
jgi:hypothetical protein